MVELVGVGGESLAGMDPGGYNVQGTAGGNLIGGGGVDLSGGQGGVGGFFSQNKDLLNTLGAGAAAGAGLLFAKQGQLPYLPQLQGVASKAAGLGENAGRLFAEQQALTNPLLTGVLPPGAEAKISDMAKRQRTATQGTYARLGQTGSTMERDALNDIQTRSEALRFDIAKEMAQVGVQFSNQAIHALTSELQIEGTIYQNLMQAQMKQDSAMASSIGNFAKALGTVAGAAGGFMIGGPAGAMAGGSLGGAAGGAVGSAIS